MKHFLYTTFISFFALLSVACSSDKDGEEVVTPPTLFLTLSSPDIDVPYNCGTTDEITIFANCDWSAVLKNQQDSEWIEFSPANGGTGEESVTITIGDNETTQDRNATLVFSYGNGESKTYTVKQPKKQVVRLGKEGGVFEIAPKHDLYDFEVSIPEDAQGWLRDLTWDVYATEEEDKLVFSADVNTRKDGRNTTIEFSVEDFRFEVDVIQEEGFEFETRSDGEYILLHEATIGKGVNIVIMGDGYTEEEINADGKYDEDLREAVEHFFSVYPYSEYRDYFNVWMMYAVSAESGTTVTSEGIKKNTKFNTVLAGDSSGISCRTRTVKEWVRSIPGIDDLDEITAILMINTPRYAGTCYMEATGFSIAMCPKIENDDLNYGARAVVMHEVGGHGFGKLADEYKYGGTISDAEVKEIKIWQQEYDSNTNVDFTSNLNDILWKDFLEYDKYTTNAAVYSVGAYQGGATYSYGVWRPETNSCMNNNIDYYNAPSRWAIVKRIMRIADIGYGFEDFIQNDNPPTPTYTRSASSATNADFIPFGPPILVRP